MKKIAFLLIGSIFITLKAKAQTDWVKINLSPRFSIKFPETPQKVANPKADVFMVKGKDSTGYVAMMIDFISMGTGLDSATLAPLATQQQFADQLVSGMASSMKGYTLTPVTIGKWNNYTSYTLSGTSPALKGKLQMLVILIGTNMYGLMAINKDETTANNVDRFFKSAQVEK